MGFICYIFKAIGSLKPPKGRYANEANDSRENPRHFSDIKGMDLQNVLRENVLYSVGGKQENAKV